MDLNYIIQEKETELWLSLDYHDGSEVIRVQKFSGAYRFKTPEKAEQFLKYHNLDKSKHSLFKRETVARHIGWGESKSN